MFGYNIELVHSYYCFFFFFWHIYSFEIFSNGKKKKYFCGKMNKYIISKPQQQNDKGPSGNHIVKLMPQFPGSKLAVTNFL